MNGAAQDRLAFRANPVRQFFSPAPWSSTAYLLSYLPVGTVLFVVALVVPLISAVACLTWIGLPLLVIAAQVLRGCAGVERGRSSLVGRRIRGEYASGDGGVVAAVRRWWTDNATWRAAGYLVGLYIPLVVLDLTVAAVWVVLLLVLTCPAWFWAVPWTFDNGMHAHGIALGYLPDGPHGTNGAGIWIGSVPDALIAACAAAVAALGFCYVLVAAARLHRYAARKMLGPRVDPLAAAHAVLARRATEA